MKLLIVDDEINTRKGIINRLPLKEMGITEVYDADDGINGLKAVSAFKPDIILTDVRMPRMDGVEMIYKVREQLPSCQVIFMSGYSDKEYLKSAIDLKAVNYIEKPINMNELLDALRTSVSLHEKEINKKKLVETSRILLKNELTLQLISSEPRWNAIERNMQATSIHIPSEGAFVTILLRIDNKYSAEFTDSHKIMFDSIMESIRKSTRLLGIWAQKKEEYIVVLLYADRNLKHLFSRERLENACSIILDEMSSFISAFISIGKTVTGIQNIYSTYESALLGIQRAFFHEPGDVIWFSDISMTHYRFSPDKLNRFSELIAQESGDKAEFLVKSLTSDIKRFDATPINECKDYYYRLLLELVNASKKYGIRLPEVPVLDADIWEKFLNFTSIHEMENFLLRQISAYFQNLSEEKINNGAVIAAIQYISVHYHEEDMTICRISEHTNLTPAYLSHVFKKATGKTLVKYINDFRIEKAKELLRDKKLRISDIAAEVGYGDSNYFTKVFRKSCGLTPSEYREQSL